MSKSTFERLYELIGEDLSGRRVVKLEPPVKVRSVDPLSAMYAYVTYEPKLSRYALKFFADDLFPHEYVTHYLPGPHFRDDTVFEIANFSNESSE